MWRLFVLGAILLYPIPSLAQVSFLDGNALYSQLQISDRILDKQVGVNEIDIQHANRGVGYVIGVSDALNGVEHCVPSEVRIRQIVEITSNFLQAYPEKRHWNAASLVSSAIKEKFPCAKR